MCIRSIRLSLPVKDSKGNVISDSKLEEKEYLRTGDKKLAVSKTRNNEKNERLFSYWKELT